jgi:hypothetical protein
VLLNYLKVGGYKQPLKTTNLQVSHSRQGPMSGVLTEGFNRVIEQTKRVGCGFRNMTNYRRRIMVHIALTRRRPETRLGSFA